MHAHMCMLCAYVYVIRKPWIGTICGLPCANRGSTLCATIHGLSAQTVDPRFAQNKVRRHKLKGQEAIVERDCNRRHKAMLGIRILG